jgi:hypothetical protein
MTTKAQLTEQTEAREKLRELLPPGTVVTTVLQHVSRSGMSRSIKCVIADTEVGVWDITGYVATALGTTRDRYWGIKRDGCGMDFGFDLVYSLSRALYPDGFLCIGEGCPSNDHRNGVPGPAHASGGYALKQRWL